MTTGRKVVLYIAASLDGYIAKPNDDLSFLSLVQSTGEDFGYDELKKSIDTVIMGRKTFDWVMNQIGGVPHPDTDTYVITRTKRPDIGKTKFYTETLTDLVRKLKEETGKNIYCDGGAEIVSELLKEKLIVEFIISIIPVLLGEGTRLFKDGRPEQELMLVSAKQFKSGLAQLHYKRADK
ncbi:MAG: dihydrofolate reductase family protein [Saprospiraceae bacterium]